MLARILYISICIAWPQGSCTCSACTSHMPAWPGMYAAKVLEWQCGQALLQCTGLYVEGMDRSDGDVAALERRWLKPIYTAAPQLVLRYAQNGPQVSAECYPNIVHGARTMA